MTKSSSSLLHKYMATLSTETILLDLGLSINEVRLYLAALELGKTSAQDIAKKAGIIRTTAYSTLEKMTMAGYIYKSKEKNKNRYFAEAPKNLLLKFARTEHRLRESLPELEALNNKNQIKPKIVFFEGKESLMDVYEDTILEKPKEILEFNTADIFEYKSAVINYLKQRLEKNIHAKRIAPQSGEWSQHAKKDKEELSVTKLLPVTEYNPNVEINVYNNKVAVMSYADELGVIIESAPIAEALRQIHKLVWSKL